PRAGPGRAGGGRGMSLNTHQQHWRAQVIPANDGRITISVPIQIKRRSGRKLARLPQLGPRKPVTC
ncbi:MAG: hypothetical protein LC776_06095, partial [Acidobacteria bacterium]|nr:hypothetical protein [Acidobacteriota bacterium]